MSLSRAWADEVNHVLPKEGQQQMCVYNVVLPSTSWEAHNRIMSMTE